MKQKAAARSAAFLCGDARRWFDASGLGLWLPDLRYAQAGKERQGFDLPFLPFPMNAQRSVRDP